MLHPDVRRIADHVGEPSALAMEGRAVEGVAPLHVPCDALARIARFERRFQARPAAGDSLAVNVVAGHPPQGGERVLAPKRCQQPLGGGNEERAVAARGIADGGGREFAGVGGERVVQYQRDDPFRGVDHAVALADGWGWGCHGLRCRNSMRRLMLGKKRPMLSSLASAFLQDYLTLGLGLAAISLFAGGLSGLVNGLIALRAPAGRHGAAFGTAQLAHAFGVALGPLVGGAAVIGWGLRSVFLLDVAAFALVLLVVAALLGGACGARE